MRIKKAERDPEGNLILTPPTFVFDIDKDSYHQIQTATLGDASYQLEWQWNDRDESWMLFVGMVGQDPSVGVKITNIKDMLKSYKHLEGVPKGELTCGSFYYPSDRVDRSLGKEGNFYLVYIEPF